MSEIEKYYNGTIHVDFEEEDLISEIIEQNKEIERLHSIIKEVREYVEQCVDFVSVDVEEIGRLEYILGILEKENKK